MPDIRITLLLVVSTLLIFALPSWAWGNVRGLLAHPARAGTFLVAAAGALAFLFSGMDFTSLKWEDRRTRIVIPALIAITAPLLLLPAYADRRGIMVVDGDAVRYLGLVVYSTGCVLRVGPMFMLEKRFRAPLDDPGATLPRHDRVLSLHPPPELSRGDSCLAGMVPGVSLLDRLRLR